MRAWRAALVGLSVASALALPAAWAGAEDAPDFTLPAPPPVVVAVPGAPRADAHLLPDLPEAPVTITAGDRIRSAIVALLPQVDRLAARLPRRDREALAAYYAVNPAIFVGDRAWTAGRQSRHAPPQGRRRGRARPDRLPRARRRGPRPPPADWAETEIRLAPPRSATPATRAARASIRRDLELVTPTLVLSGADEVLAGLAAGADADEALAAYNPPHPGYRALRARLAAAARRPPGGAEGAGARTAAPCGSACATRACR